MIQKHFAVHVLVKDIELSDEENKEITELVYSLISYYRASTNKDLYDITENSIPLFTKENMEKYPILRKLRNVFVDGFLELAESYDNNQYTREIIEKVLANNTGRLPIMKTGECKDNHTHVGASAFGIFYLDEVDNKKHGGYLKMYDPAGANIVGYTNPQTITFETVKNRLIIAPANVWHSVSTYTGKEDRLAIVFNLDWGTVNIADL